MTDQDASLRYEGFGRRTFLKVLGTAAPAAVLSACSVPDTRIIPYVIPPDQGIPGVATWYASVCGECPAGCGTLVKTREGRPIKIEGNPQHPINQGALCVRGQAALQGLYDPDRIPGPRRRRTTSDRGDSVLDPVSWDEAQATLVERITMLRQAGRADRIAVVTGAASRTLDALVSRWTTAIGARPHLRYEPFAYEAVRAASRLTFGRDAIPHYDLARADVLISFGADFLETWLSPVGYTRDFTARRRANDGGGGRPARFIHIEPRLSMTAAQADEWIAAAPGTEVLLALAMVHVIVAENRAQGLAPSSATALSALVRDYAPASVADRTGVEASRIETLARAFSDPGVGAGRSLALAGGVAASGSNATPTQIAVNLLNYVAGNIGQTVQFGPDTTFGRLSPHSELLALVEAMRAGEVELLILHGINPVFSLPPGVRVAEALQRVPFVVSCSSFLDETTAQANLVLPTHTPLEAWGDEEPRVGVLGLRQPAITPLGDSRHAGDVLLDVGRAVGEEVAGLLPPEDFYTYLRSEWQALQGRVAPGEDFETFWEAAQKRGGYWQTAPVEPVQVSPEVFKTRFEPAAPAGADRPYVLVVYPSLLLYDGRGANKPWLQEIPDPMTKTGWTTCVEIHPDTASTLGVAQGQVVTVASPEGAIDAPALLNAHLRPDVIAIPIGQGHTQYGRYAAQHGSNPIALLPHSVEQGSGAQSWLSTRVTVTPRALFRPVPRTQRVFDQMGRGIAQAVTLGELSEPPEARREEHPSLYPDHEHPDHRWGMAIDLDSCTGCNACVAACYAENNVPVVGPDQMARGRHMAWLRIDRFDEPGDRADTRFVPMLCQHCDHAPCEAVCPVFATYHTPDGLNAQVYNRCVGTRYCANNCPYSVRVFNWFEPSFPAPLNLQLNPDVTPRSKGVMEKCTFCVQRIQQGKHRAKDAGRAVQDSDVTPACAQTCPAQAIVFGDLADPNSRVSRQAADRRSYYVFEGLNTRPAITYLKKVQRTP